MYTIFVFKILPLLEIKKNLFYLTKNSKQGKNLSVVCPLCEIQKYKMSDGKNGASKTDFECNLSGCSSKKKVKKIATK